MGVVYRARQMSLGRDAKDQYRQGRSVQRSELRPGDGVFYRTNPDRPGASHVGLYIGDGQVIHASARRGVVVDQLDSPYLRKRYLGARRM